MNADRVAIVLPPKEGFSPAAVGAIGLIVHRLATSAGGVVIGAPQGYPPFDDVTFVPAPAVGWAPLGRIGRYVASVARALRQIRPMIIEVHNRPAVALGLIAAFPRTPMSLFLNNDPQGMRGARSPAERAALIDQMRVVTASEYLRGRLLDGVPQRMVSLLPNALDSREMPPQLPPEARERTILFVGRIVADKGADAFVRACATTLPSLPNWRAEMIGADRFSPDSPQTPFVRRLLPAASAAGVTMHGYRPHAEVLAAMARAAIVVVPSRWAEPFGMTALEAMASGAALICSGTGGLSEVVGQAALIADPDAQGALEGAIMRLATSAPDRHVLSETGLRRARMFDITEVAAALTALRRAMLCS